MARIAWSREALDTLDEIAAYIALDDPSAAARTAQSLFAAGNSLADFPDRGRPARTPYRELASVRPYVITYRVADGIVFIVGIRHMAQNR